MRKILPTIIATITGKARYLPKIEWSSKSLTHNFFRFFEMIFGREHGVRAEVSILNLNGTLTFRAHTIEGVCLVVEHSIREFLKVPKFKIVKVYLPVFSFAGINNITQKQPYLFAIAYVSSGSDAGHDMNPDDQTYSFSTSGSDRCLAMCITAGNSIGSPGNYRLKYNSVDDTGVLYRAGGYPYTRTGYLNNPATGSNTVLMHYGGTSGSQSGMSAVVLMTGVNQTTPYGGTGENYVPGTSISANVTSTIANSLIIDFLIEQNNIAVTKGASQTQNIQNGYSGSSTILIASSRQSAPTVTTYTMSWTVGSGQIMLLHAMEFVPSVASLIIPRIKTLQAVIRASRY